MEVYRNWKWYYLINFFYVSRVRSGRFSLRNPHPRSGDNKVVEGFHGDCTSVSTRSDPTYPHDFLLTGRTESLHIVLGLSFCHLFRNLSQFVVYVDSPNNEKEQDSERWLRNLIPAVLIVCFWTLRVNLSLNSVWLIKNLKISYSYKVRSKPYIHLYDVPINIKWTVGIQPRRKGRRRLSPSPRLDE